MSEQHETPQQGQPYYPQYPQYSRYDQQAYSYENAYASAGAPQYPAQYPAQQPQPAPAGGTGRSLVIGFGAALAATALVLGGVALASGTNDTLQGSGTLQLPVNPNQQQPGQQLPNQLPGGSGGSGGGQSGSGNSRSGTANATQQIGVVTIVSTLKYQNAQSAGTGMVISADGDVLTNNHVIRGATSIAVTVESTGRTYRATVVGTAPGSDVAMIKLQDASGLATAKLADDATDVQVGDDVVGVGNGGGTGTLTAAEGKVTGLDKSITAADETGQDTERLNGLIEINAGIISGDSGGPLYDAGGEIVGVNTAASASRTSTPTAYAIPIEDAMGIVKRIESGVETADIHIGYPGFLGVTTRDANGQGAAVVGLLDGGPAADAGIDTGSVITGVDGKAVTSSQGLRNYLTQLDPGTSVRITWTDASGQTQSATVTLAVGPAD